jgi:quercetin dioxygenase-like cupin family protein
VPAAASQGPARGPEAIATIALSSVIGDGLAGDGVHWTLDESDDLNVNLVHLEAGSVVAAHVNSALEVVIVVLDGTGRVVIDGDTRPLTILTLILVPKDAERSIHAGDAGLTYLTVHRRRGPLEIKTKDTSNG